MPARDRIGDKTLRDLRTVPRPIGPIRVARTAPTQTDQAQVRDGFFASDVQEVRDTRLLIMASRVLSTRMNRILREERQLVYSIGAGVRPGEAYPGFGMFAAQAPTDPGKAETLAVAIEEMYAAFAGTGPTGEELAVARQQLSTFLDEAMKGPDFWSERLATLDYRGLTLAEVARIAADYGSFTAERDPRGLRPLLPARSALPLRHPARAPPLAPRLARASFSRRGGISRARCSTAAGRPPEPWGMPRAASPISMAPRTPNTMGALTWPMWAMRKALPASSPMPTPTTTPQCARQ